ncbi:hypothetical protein [Sphingomonas mollis]|uniref:Hemerythrin domain-containing protein n=1 Tax=Sphingomonas mollis TaxID=2795726 RepID=A0ABS0XQT1_9SPHN|nr:hypothetical protein [Sphingomonas sp. BT553]MBJ6122145.1 hypothetical protein [Sphingomonas sp. BT553]
MDVSASLARLHEHQDRILTILDRATNLIHGDPDRNRAGLATSRWEMARRLREYQLFKHRELFDPMIAGGDPDQRRRARLMKADCILLSEDFQTHVARWSGVDVADDWITYRRAMLAITTRLRGAVMRERHEFSQTLRMAPGPVSPTRITVTG